jgi:hypothetical protein
LTTTQVNSLTSAQLNALSTDNIKYLNI